MAKILASRWATLRYYRCRCFLSFAILALSSPAAWSADGVWTTSGDGAWSNTANWSGGIVGTGTSGSADFSGLDIAADTTVTLDTGTRLIAHMKFGDVVPDFNWTVQNNTLILDVSTITDTPTINVVNQTATISSQLSSGTTAGGKVGFIKLGAGTLVLASGTAVNNYTGSTYIDAGTLRLGNSGVIPDGSLVFVNAGATFDVNDKNESIWFLTGGGNVTLGSGSLDFNGLGGLFTGVISGTGNIAKSGAQSRQYLLGLSSYTGTTSVTGGASLAINTLGNVNGGDSSLGNPDTAEHGTIDLSRGDSRLGGNETTFQYLGASTSSDRIIRLTQGANPFGTTNIEVSLAGTELKLTSGIIEASAGLGLVKGGPGALALEAANTYTGTTTVTGGAMVLRGDGSLASTSVIVQNGATLRLDNNAATNNDNRLADAATITLGGGNLDYRGNSAAPSSETIGPLVIGTGASAVTATSNGGQSATLTLGAITRNAGGTVNFTLPASGGISLASDASGGILGGYATIGDNWVTNAGSGTPLAPFAANNSKNDAATWTTGDNITNSAAFTGSTGTVAINTLRFGAAAASAVSINPGETLTLGAGGVLVTSSVGANPTAISGGTLTSGNAQDLIVIQNSSASLTIDSTIVDNGGTLGLTKSGTGRLVLNGSNSFSGAMRINEGTVSVASVADVGSASPFGTGADIAIGDSAAGATLEFTGSGSTNRGISIPRGGTATINITNPGTSLIVGGNVVLSAGSATTDAGNLTKTGPGTLVFTGVLNVMRGTLVVAQGVVEESSPTLNFDDQLNITVNAGATLKMTNVGAGNQRYDKIDDLNGAGDVVLTNTALGLGDGGGLGGDFSGTISGTGGTVSPDLGVTGVPTGLIKTFFGTQTFSGTAPNTYTLPTRVVEGGLNLNKIAGVDAIPGDLFIGDPAQAQRPFMPAKVKLLQSDQISDAATVGVYSRGILDLNGKNESFSSLQGNGRTGLVALGSGTLTVGLNDANSNYAGAFSGNGKVIKVGAGSFTVAGDSADFSGIFDVAFGTVLIGKDYFAVPQGTTNPRVLGTGTLILREVTMATTNAASRGVLMTTVEYRGDPTFGQTVGGTGQVTLSAAHTMFRNTKLNVVQDTTFDGAWQESGGSFDLTLEVNDGAIASFTGSDDSTYTGTTTINNASGTGVATMRLDKGIDGVSTTTTMIPGPLVINAATILRYATAAVSTNAIADISDVTINTGGILNLNGRTDTINALNGGGAVTLGTGTLAVGGSGGGGTFSGVISESGNLAKVGAGTLILTGDNTYTGATTIDGGTLAVQGSLANTAVALNDGGTLAGGGTIGGPITVNTGGALSPGNSPGTLTAQAGVSFAAGSQFAWELAAETTSDPGTSWDRVAVAGGNLSVDVDAELLLLFSGSTAGPSTNAFWNATQRWTHVLDVLGGGSILGTTFTIDNSAFSGLGSFATVLAEDSAGIDLVWNPGLVPVHPWQNPRDPLDVDDSGVVKPLDVLIIINELNARGQRNLTVPPVFPDEPPPYYDVSGDDAIKPIDALMVINYLNSQTGLLSAEGLDALIASSGDFSGLRALLLDGEVDDPPPEAVPEPSSIALAILTLCASGPVLRNLRRARRQGA